MTAGKRAAAPIELSEEQRAELLAGCAGEALKLGDLLGSRTLPARITTESICRIGDMINAVITELERAVCPCEERGAS